MRKLPKKKTLQKTPEEIRNQLRLSPVFKAARALAALQDKDINVDILPGLMTQLIEDSKPILKGDTNQIEVMLYLQSVVLNEIFMHLITVFRDQKNTQAQTAVLNWAFRAQDLSRKASGLLVDIKNPRRSTFIKQQMNQLNVQGDSSPDPNLLEQTQNATMDTGIAPMPITDDPEMATVEPIDRASD